MFYLRLLIIFWKTVPRATLSLARQSLTLSLFRETELNRRNGKAATTISSLTQPDQESMDQQMKMRKKHDQNWTCFLFITGGKLQLRHSGTGCTPVCSRLIWKRYFRDPTAQYEKPAQAWVCQAMPWKTRSQDRTLQEELLSTALLKCGAACWTTSSAL